MRLADAGWVGAGVDDDLKGVVHIGFDRDFEEPVARLTPEQAIAFGLEIIAAGHKSEVIARVANSLSVQMELPREKVHAMMRLLLMDGGDEVK